MSIKFSSALLVVVLVAALMMTAASGMNLDKADKVAEVTPKPKAKKPPGPECPCGYAVYFPLSRILEYYVRNESCECPPTQKCMRTHDDLSASAYVYHCRKLETNS